MRAVLVSCVCQKRRYAQLAQRVRNLFEDCDEVAQLGDTLSVRVRSMQVVVSETDAGGLRSHQLTVGSCHTVNNFC